MAFITGYNDIDHLAPVLWSLNTGEWRCRIDLVNTDIHTDCSEDYRVKFLIEQGNVQVINLKDQVASIRRLDRLRSIANRFGRRNPLRRLFRKVLSLIRQRAAERMLVDFNAREKLIDPRQPDLILVDLSSPFYTSNRSFQTVAHIPLVFYIHGLDPLENRLFSTDILSKNDIGSSLGIYNRKHIFIVAYNDQYKTKLTQRGVDPKRIIVIGSPRFTMKWATLLKDLTPASQRVKQLQRSGKNVFTVVLMMSKWHYNIWQDETLRIIRTLLHMEGVRLVIKPHTRGMTMDGISIQQKEKLTIADENDHSNKLIEIADLVLFSISSIFLEALLQKKNVLHLQCTTSNRLLSDRIQTRWKILCRDDLVDYIEKLKHKKCEQVYSDDERENCLYLYSGDENGDVLDRYRHFLLSSVSRFQQTGT